MEVLRCKKCRKEVTAKELSYITLPYARTTISMIGMCKECYKELERWLDINERLAEQTDKS